MCGQSLLSTWTTSPHTWQVQSVMHRPSLCSVHSPTGRCDGQPWLTPSAHAGIGLVAKLAVQRRPVFGLSVIGQPFPAVQSLCPLPARRVMYKISPP
jgi:hypothetical protein